MSKQLSSIIYVFNPEKHYLSSVCKRKHYYNNTQQSIRRKCNGNCLYCERLNHYDWAIDHPHKVKRNSAIFRQKHREDINKKNREKDRKQEKKEYYLKNREEILKKQKLKRNKK